MRRYHIPLCILMMFAILSAISAVALADDLDFDYIEITRDGERLLKTSGDSGSFDVEPGDQLRITIKLENNLDDDNDMEDVDVEAVITDIDDGDDIDDDDTVDIRGDGYKIVKLSLDIPDDASSYESYELEITAEGTDQNGTRHTARAEFDIDVDRETHELVFEDIRIDDMRCDREPYLQLEIQNTGEEPEYDIELKISSPSLGTVFSDTFDLDTIDEGEDSYYSLNRRLDLDGLPTGTNTVRVRVEYNDGREHIERVLEFDVESCYSSGSDSWSDSDSDRESYRESARDVRTERYSNPNRDLSFLYGDENIPVELFTTPNDIPTTGIDAPAQKTSTLTLVALAMANLAVLVFIAIMLWVLYDSYY